MNKNAARWVLFLFFLCRSNAALANFRLGVGQYQWYYDSSISYFLQIDKSFTLGSSKNQFLIGEFGYILPERKFLVKREHYFLNLDYAYQTRRFRFRAGSGVLVRKITGEGGGQPVETYNSTGYYSNPSKSYTGYVLPLNLSVELLFKFGFAKLGWQILQPLDNVRRNFTQTLTVGINL